jgi:hypothetical protein
MRPKFADVVVWLERKLYLSGQASSKKGAHDVALAIVEELVDKGLLVLEDAKPVSK